jgi:hypothetical protein
MALMDRLARAIVGYAEGLLGALWLLAPLISGVAAAVTVVVYLLLPETPNVSPPVPADPAVAITAGVAVAAIAWLIGGVLWRPMASASRAQPRIFSELMQRLVTLRDRLASMDGAVAEGGVHHEGASQLRYAAEQLASGPAFRWALAYGYVDVFRALHRAEEAILVLQPVANTVGDALHDALSLDGSTISNRDRLSGVIRVALHKVSAAAAEDLLPSDPGTKQSDSELSQGEAREALREVRFAINDFRDDRQDGLIRARNRLVWTMVAVGVTTYLLLGLAVLKDVGKPYVCAAAVFYLVGAIVGLFNRLRGESQRSSAVEDFGLFQARLITTPLVSGLAAVAGVFLVGQASLLTGGAASTAGTAAAGTAAAAAGKSLAEIFDLTANQIGLLYAAIFGLTPGALTSTLQRQTERLEKDLQASEPASSEGGT